MSRLAIGRHVVRAVPEPPPKQSTIAVAGVAGLHPPPPLVPQPVKTPSGERSVALDTATIALLRWHRGRQDKLRRVIGPFTLIDGMGRFLAFGHGYRGVVVGQFLPR